MTGASLSIGVPARDILLLVENCLLTPGAAELSGVQVRLAETG